MAVTMITDEQGGEVRVETGIGTVIGVEPKGDRNVRVRIDADHLREEVQCWVDRQGPLWPRIEWAYDHGAKIWYRIDVHRKRSIGPSKPLSQLSPRDKVRDLVGVERPEHAPASIEGGTPPPPTPPERRQQAAAAQPAQQPTGQQQSTGAAARSALNQLTRAARGGNNPPEVLTFLINMATDLGATQADIDAAIEAARPPTPAEQARQQRAQQLPQQALAGARDPDRVGERSVNNPMPDPPPGNASNGQRPSMSATSGLGRRAQPVASDARPWEATNSDGRPNLSSYAAGACMEMTTLASRLLVTRARARHEADPTYQLEPPGPRQVFGLAQQLLNIADTIQHHMRSGGRVDRMASSHKLARQAVRESLDLYPVPWGAEADERAAWRQAMVEHGTTLCNVMLDLFDNREQPSTAAAAVAAEQSA